MNQPPPFIDSHCHIDAVDFNNDQDLVLARAKQAGVQKMVVVSIAPNLEAARRTVEFAKNIPNVYPTVGVHPHNAENLNDSWWTPLCELASDPDVVAIGETGLDFFYDSSPRAIQEELFLRHIALAKSLNKPIICHIRDAHDEAFKILSQHAAGKVPTIIHCFTGTPEVAKKYVDLGFYISFSGIITFKGKSIAPIRESVLVVPDNQLLIETDSPYLAPVPFRGKRNEPAFLIEIANIIANLRGIELTALSEIIVKNTDHVFTLTSG